MAQQPPRLLRTLRVGYLLCAVVAVVALAIMAVAGIADPSALGWGDARVVAGVVLIFGSIWFWRWRLPLLRTHPSQSVSAAKKRYAFAVVAPHAAMMILAGYLLFGWLGAAAFAGLDAFMAVAVYRKLFPPSTTLANRS